MRKARAGGLCSRCGAESDAGLYWHSVAVVLDFGVDGVAPVEPDMTAGCRCDACELLVRVVEAYRDAPDAARRIYCAATAADALRLLGWRASAGRAT